MNVVEIIIKAVTKDAEKNIQKVETRLDKFKKIASGAANDVKSIGVAAGIAVGILYSFGRALEWVGEQAERLGRRDVAASIDRVGTTIQGIVDQLLTLNVAGNDALDIAKFFADAWVTGVKLIQVALEGMFHQFNLTTIGIKRTIGEILEATGQVTEWTEAWRDAAIAEENASSETRKHLIWVGKLSQELEKAAMSQKNLRQSQTRTGESLDKLIAKNKALNDELYRRKHAEDDAIRAGDALALAEARATGGAGYAGGPTQRPINGPTANGGRGVGSGANGMGNMTVIAQFGDEYIEGKVKRILKDDVFKPTTKAKTGGKKK